MTLKNSIKTITLIAGMAFGLAAPTLAQGTGPNGTGLLGQEYGAIGYSYNDLHNSPINAQSLDIGFNKPLYAGIDLNAFASDGRSSAYYGIREYQKNVGASITAFQADQKWGRPYVSAGAGWLWMKVEDFKLNSFMYDAEVGVEFQATRELAVTPFVNFTDTTAFSIDNKWSYGVKASYWLTHRVALTASVSRDNMVNTAYGVGVVFRF